MKLFSKAALLLALVPAAPVVLAATAHADEVLGCREVSLDAERDVIRVGKQEGRWTAIRLGVAGNDVEVYDLKVVYGNGKVDDFQVRSVIPKGGETRWIDLKGDGKKIQQIEFVYRAVKIKKGNATLCAHGR